jgi:hypothetical protein
MKRAELAPSAVRIGELLEGPVDRLRAPSREKRSHEVLKSRGTRRRMAELHSGPGN